MAGELDGRVAVITGSARGIGKEIARTFIAAGARVVVSDRDTDAMQATADELGAAAAIACDVTDEGQVQNLFEQAAAQLGGVHVAVANAGVGRPVPIAAMDLAEWRSVTSVNLDGVFLTIRYGAPAIAEAGGGSIVVVSSITALAGSGLIAHYGAAKAGAYNLAKTAAVEFRPAGVRVNAVLPGFIGTELVTAAKPTFEELLGLPSGGFDGLIEQKQGRYGEPADVASAALFLAAEQSSSWITGNAIVLDGGLSGSLL